MEILAIFDESYSGAPGDAVWIVDSVSNRNWFAMAQSRLDENSAIFSWERYSSLESALCYMIWGIHDHFPDWQRILVVGWPPDRSLPIEMQEEGRWERRPDGLVLYRA